MDIILVITLSSALQDITEALQRSPPSYRPLPARSPRQALNRCAGRESNCSCGAMSIARSLRPSRLKDSFCHRGSALGAVCCNLKPSFHLKLKQRGLQCSPLASIKGTVRPSHACFHHLSPFPAPRASPSPRPTGATG
jgi:hypothetical protein